MSAPGHDAQQAAQAPVSRPNTAPVDSGAIGRLNERQRAEIGWAVERDWQLRDQRDDWDGLYAVVERIVREHTDRALADVEKRIEALAVANDIRMGRSGASAYTGIGSDALRAILRAARQEQNRG